MLLLGDDGDSLGGEDGAGTYILHEISDAPPEYLAQLRQSYIFTFRYFVPELRQIRHKLLGGKEFEEHRRVDVFPPSFCVYIAYGHIELR